jgi:acetyl esterase/lipase
MTSISHVDKELLPMLERFQTLEIVPEAIPELRAGLRTQILALAPGESPAVGKVVCHIPGPPGAPDVRVLIYTPKSPAQDRPALLHFHGGGYMLGLPEMTEARNLKLAETLDIIVVSVDYRLSPDTPHPGPIEDCYAALLWLREHAKSLGVNPDRIAVGGESAGGGLAASLCLLARDRKQVPIAFQLLIYPMIDDHSGSLEPRDPLTGEFIWTRETTTLGWTCLLGQTPGAADISPYAAASRAKDLKDLPPAFVGVGQLDLFREEDIDYAARLMNAGVPTELHVYPGAFHAFDLALEADVSQRFVRDYTAALGRALRA